MQEPMRRWRKLVSDIGSVVERLVRDLLTLGRRARSRSIARMRCRYAPWSARSPRSNYLATLLKRSGHVRVVGYMQRFNASTYSLVGPNRDLYRFPGATDQAYKPVDYVGTKSMVPNFTRYLGALYGREGIRSNCIVRHGASNGHPDDFRTNFFCLLPLGRMCGVREPFVLLATIDGVVTESER